MVCAPARRASALLALAACLVICLGATLTVGRSARAQDGLDVRGTWTTATVIGSAPIGPKAYQHVLVITRQTAAGDVKGSWDQHGSGASARVTGRVTGNTMNLTNRQNGRVAYRYTGKLMESDGVLTWSGTWDAPTGGFKGSFRAKLTAPIVAVSPDGGDAESAVLVVCDRDVTVNTDDAVLECTAQVTDASGRPGSVAPTGSVSWTTRVGNILPESCALASQGGSTAWCAVTLRAGASQITIGSAPQLTASYPGDARFGPSEGSPRLFGKATGYEGTNLYGPTCSPATTPKPTVGCGDPVNPATGNLSLTMVDVAVEGRGPGLELTRTYNALAAAAGAGGRFGAGWSDGYGASLRFGPKQQVTAILGSGATVPFTRKGKRFTKPGWVTATLTRAATGRYVLTFADQTRLTFDRDGRLVEVSDRSAAPITLAYATDGSLTSAADASGRSITFSVDAAGRVTSATDPAGRRVGYGYSAAGDLVSVTDVTGGVTTYAYDDHHRLQSATDGTGVIVRNTFDDRGRVVAQTDAAGNRLSLAYRGESPGVLVIATDADGNRNAYEYAGGMLIAATRGLDGEAPATDRYVYDANLRLTAVIDPDEGLWRIRPDAAGNIVASTDPLGRTTTAAWTDRNDLARITTPSGITTAFGYDDHGWLTSVTEAVGSADARVTRITRGDPAHPSDITSITDAMGAETRYGRDAYGSIISETDALGHTRSVSRDVLGWVSASTDPLGATSAFTLDAAGDLLGTTDALGGVTSLARDAAHQLTSLTDALQRTTTLAYDAVGRVTGVTLPDGTVLRTSRDAIGDVIGHVDGSGAAWTIVRDDQRRPVSWSDPLGDTWHYAWDPAGRLVTATDPLGQVTSYGWDAAGQLIAIDYPDATPGVRFTYDADGRRTSMSDRTGTTTYTWDDRGRLVSTTDGAGHTVATGYDGRGDLTRIVYPDGRVVERDYDAIGQLIAVRDGSGHQSTFAWDAAGRRTRSVGGDGSITTRTYDDRGALLGITVSRATGTVPLLSFAYDRDASGVISSFSDALAPAGAVPATRDRRGRLTALGTETFAVDAAGNLTQLRGETLSYDAAGRLLTVTGPAGTTTFMTDAAGRRTGSHESGASTSYAWDAAGRLVALDGDRYAYDGDGLRTSATHADRTTDSFAWLRSDGLPLLLGDGTSTFIHGPGGAVLEEVRPDGSVQWLHTDQAGSVRAITDESGVLTGTLTWDAYGLPVTSTGLAHTRIGYQGNYTDPDTGLQYLQARYYDPATALFLSADPMVLSTLQPFAFANGDPLTFADPAGTQSITGGGTAAAGTAARMLEGLGLAGATCTAVEEASGDPGGLRDHMEALYKETTPNTMSERLLRAVATQNREGATQMVRGQRPIPRIPGGLYAAILRGQEREQALAAQEFQRQLAERMRSTDQSLMDIQDLVVPDLNDMFSGNGPTFRGGMLGH